MDLKIEFDEKAVFNMIHSVRIASDKPYIHFHYLIEDIEKNSHSLYPVGRENSFFYIEEYINEKTKVGCIIITTE